MIVNIKRLGWLFLGLMLMSSLVQAKTIVLVHGYMAEGSVWQRSGVVGGLAKQGYPFAGRYGYSASGDVVHDVRKQGKNATVTVELPWELPIATQSKLLSQYLLAIYRHRPGPIVIVGHSAGGVVARYSLIRYPNPHAQALVTIASPHLGTPMADLGMLASDSPLGAFFQELGDPTLLRSRDLFKDLQTAREGSFLHWLNHQKHPEIAYYSIVRTSAAVDLTDYHSADMVVPPAFQMMENVPALEGRSVTISSDGGHALSVNDAGRIRRIMSQL